jgi:hypothetical protein
MLDGVVGVDDDQQIGILGELLAQQIAENRFLDRLFIDKEPALTVDRDGSALGGGLLARGSFRKVHGHAAVLGHR